MSYPILSVSQFIWYKHIFIHQLQQHKNNIVVQCSSYYGHIHVAAVVKQLVTWSPKCSGLLYPFFFATYMVLYNSLHVIIVLGIFISISEAHNGIKYVKTVINNFERFTFLSIQILPMCLISVVIIISNSFKKKAIKTCVFCEYYK